MEKMLEIGCGPGALSQALHRWYPSANVIGLDRDTNFIEFAKTNAPEINFCEGDAINLPFADNSFDVTISHTVQEHVEPEKFFNEQYRVLKHNGVCLVLSARKGINIISDTISKTSDFEDAMYKKTEEFYTATDKKYNVCKYPMSEQELPRTMLKYGFKNISTHYITLNLTPDSNNTDEKTAIEIIEANRQVNLDSLAYLPEIAPYVLTEFELKQWEDVIKRKFDKRIEQYKKFEKLWDTSVSVVMVLRGVK